MTSKVEHALEEVWSLIRESGQLVSTNPGSATHVRVEAEGGRWHKTAKAAVEASEKEAKDAAEAAAKPPDPAPSAVADAVGG